jgi:hypothetical protein
MFRKKDTKNLFYHSGQAQVRKDDMRQYSKFLRWRSNNTWTSRLRK